MTGSVEVKVVGLDKAMATLLGMLPAVNQAGFDALKTEMDGVMEVAQTLVPILNHPLEESHYVDEPVEIGEAVAIQLGYGNDEAYYALLQHETLEFTHEPGRSAKFLEIPLMAWSKDGPSRIAQQMKKAIKP